MPAGSILRRKSPHRPKEMFHGESESTIQPRPRGSLFICSHPYRWPKGPRPLGAGLHDNMHICKGYFCQGRNLAVRFLRFDFLVFSVGNVCRLCKVFFDVKNTQLGKFNELWRLSWRQAFRGVFRQPIKIKRKYYGMKGFKITQTSVRRFIPTWLDCYKSKGTWHHIIDVLLPTRWRKSNVLYLTWRQKALTLTTLFM